MTKYEFLAKLSQELSAMPRQDREKSLAYYSEMLDDYVEDGMSEEEAVDMLGNVKTVAQQILEDVPISHLVKEKVRVKRKPAAWEIVLLVLGSPVWLSLLVAAVAVVCSLFIAVFAVLISVIATLWAVGACFAGVALGGIFMAVNMFWQSFVPQGLCYLGAALLLSGLAVLMYFASLYTTIGCGKFVKNMFFHSKHSLTKGGRRDA
jgi:uncharacterized membrane protein